ncbi:MAG: isoleucine--tRNA ligase [Anaerolineae bacterium]|nr:isoleucine--tRNA ligase [Anaerolineae bacterium]
MFKPVEKNVSVLKIEQEQLDFWRLNRVFQRTLEGREDAPRYVFYEGPPTANGKPGSHHVLARAFKDMFPRYKVMNGYYVERRGGWDTHGLPVEIAVEKELGFTDKKDIEAYGVAKFNELCRKRVFSNIADWEKLTERIAYWVDLDNAYITFTNDYIESVWWILKQFWDKDLLYRGFKTIAYSPTSGTPLSSHEVSLGYKDITDPSVFVRFPLKDEQGVYVLAWTTTPWTLPGNAALALKENADYVQVEVPTADGEGTEQLILAEALVDKVLGSLEEGEERKIVKRYQGKDLLGKRYNPLYTFVPTDKDYAYIIAGDFVSLSDGTGIVHIAPAFGEDDNRMGVVHDLPFFLTVTDNGRMIEAVDKFKGLWFKDADKEIIKDLKQRGLMYKVEQYTHSYPHNWRDGQPLMYVARETWFIRTTDYKDTMVENNQKVNWVPHHIKDGRFGNWLDDLKEWALGRERYWGTPLPVWVDDQTGEMRCFGSVAELAEAAKQDLTELDLHRPYVDDITFPNPNGKGGTMRRVPEVIDVWFDSGAMQLAQWGYPHKNVEKFEEQFPADYICEAVDQTRGWFYSLHAIASMLFESVSYKNVICLGHILDGKGQKMSKSKGNIVDPWSVLDAHGADAFRWYLYTSGQPGEPRRFSADLVGEVIKKFWLTVWNSYKFFVELANIDGWTPDVGAPDVKDRPVLDRWILSELHSLVQTVTEGYETYDVTNATRPIEEFVDGLSNWYVRRSKDRFYGDELTDDKKAAYATLYECLTTLAYLLAPAMPFLSEKLYRALVTEVDSNALDSVHLAVWPQADTGKIDTELAREMALVRQLVSMGHAARNSAELSVRQPLQSVGFGVSNAEERASVTKYDAVIKNELNVKNIEILQEAAGVTSYTLKPDFSKLGRKLRGDVKKVANALQNANDTDAANWGRALLKDETITLTVDGKVYDLAPDEVEVRQESAAEGYVIYEDRGYVAALNTNLTDDLMKERLANEVQRRIQVARKDADFNIEDRIEILYQASDNLQAAIEQFSERIQRETLANSMTQGDSSNGFFTKDFSSDLPKDLKDEKLVISVKQV